MGFSANDGRAGICRGLRERRAGAMLEAKLEFVERYWELGYRSFKLYFESDWAALLELIDNMQARYRGIRVAVDALWHLPEDRAVRCGCELADRGILWLECPLLPEDVEGHVRLVEESGVRLALGESYRTRYEALPFLDRDIVSFWQPDLGRSGLSETLALGELARARGVAIVPHVSIAMPPQLNAAIRAAKSIPNCALLEYNPSVVEMANRFAASPLVLREGAYFSGTAPWGAGLGFFGGVVVGVWLGRPGARVQQHAVQAAAHGLEELGLLGAEVVLFAEVGGEIVEFLALVFEEADDLEGTTAERGAGAAELRAVVGVVPEEIALG